MSDENIKSAAELAAERAARLQESAAVEANAPESATPTQDQSAATNDATASSETPAPAPSELQQKIASQQEELEAQRDKYLRLVAEFDNFRRRNAREYVEMQETAQAKAFQGLFPVIDNFERAFADAPSEGDWTPADPAGFAKGMRLIRDQIRKILADGGLEEIQAEGNPFDPNHHDALTQMPHPTVPADHVAAIHARGWKKGEKILRHAQVIVSSGPSA